MTWPLSAARIGMPAAMARSTPAWKCAWPNSAGSPASSLGPKGCVVVAPGTGQASSPGASGGPAGRAAGAAMLSPWLTPTLSANTIIRTGSTTIATVTPMPVSSRAIARRRLETAAPATRSRSCPASALRAARPMAPAVLTRPPTGPGAAVVATLPPPHRCICEAIGSGAASTCLWGWPHLNGSVQYSSCSGS